MLEWGWSRLQSCGRAVLFAIQEANANRKVVLVARSYYTLQYKGIIPNLSDVNFLGYLGITTVNEWLWNKCITNIRKCYNFHKQNFQVVQAMRGQGRP